MHWLANGLGIAFGKIAELTGVLDIGFQTRFFGGILQPVLTEGTNFDNVMTPNTYTLKNITSAGYLNCPFTSGTGKLKVEACGEEGQIHQIVEVCSKTNKLTYERFYYQNSWGEWVNTTVWGGKLLWSGGYYMQASHIIQLSEPISQQPNGIVLVFSRYSSGAAQDYHFNCFFIPKAQIALHPGAGHQFLLSADGSFSLMASKYLYINNTSIVGHDNNKASGTGASGISYENNGFVLRYVIGV